MGNEEDVLLLGRVLLGDEEALLALTVGTRPTSTPWPGGS